MAMSGLLGLGDYGTDSENEDEDKSSVSTSQTSKRDGKQKVIGG